MIKKKIGVTLDEELHKRVKSTASIHGMTVEAAYDQALRNWLSVFDKSAKDPGNAQVTSETMGYYTVHVARAAEKAAQLAKTLGEVIFELEAVAGDGGGPIAVAKAPSSKATQDATEEINRAAQGFVDGIRRSRRSLERIQGRTEDLLNKGGRNKKSRNTGLSGGAA